MSQLEQALIAVVRFLDEHRVPYMVIGGIANILWGIPRTTLDVDLTIWIPDEKIPEFVREVGERFSCRPPGDPVAFSRETRVLPIETKEGVGVDIVFGQLLFEQEAIERAAKQVIQGVEVRVCQPEDLILHKLTSEREKDRQDVRGIILQQHKRLDRKYLDAQIKFLAQGMDRLDIQTWYEQCLKEAGEAKTR